MESWRLCTTGIRTGHDYPHYVFVSHPLYEMRELIHFNRGLINISSKVVCDYTSKLLDIVKLHAIDYCMELWEYLQNNEVDSDMSEVLYRSIDHANNMLRLKMHDLKWIKQSGDSKVIPLTLGFFQTFAVVQWKENWKDCLMLKNEGTYWAAKKLGIPRIGRCITH